MGAFVSTILAPPPKNETVLTRTGSSLFFAALYHGQWITVPKEEVMKYPPAEWYDRTADAPDEAEALPPTQIPYGKGQMTFDFDCQPPPRSVKKE